MGELRATFKKHLSQIAQAQLIAQPPEHNEQDNISRIFQKVE
jgi:hypothetical protein